MWENSVETLSWAKLFLQMVNRCLVLNETSDKCLYLGSDYSQLLLLQTPSVPRVSVLNNVICNSRNLCQSNICKLFIFAWDLAAVCIIRVSVIVRYPQGES